MSSPGWSRLRALLIAEYDQLIAQMAKRLGSKDLADEAVHEAYIRIERGGEIGEISRPRSYLYRMTSNIAADRRKAENLRAAKDNADELEQVADPGPSAEEVVAGRERLSKLRQALDAMPRRRREIASAAWFEDMSTKEIAARFSVSERTVQNETRIALMHCAQKLRPRRAKE